MSGHKVSKTWFGQPVKFSEILLEELIQTLPEFRRMPFGDGNNRNEYMDMIVRVPHGDDKRTIPVATVSTRYALIQHIQVLEWIKEGVKAMGFLTNRLVVRLTISPYGERLTVSLKIPGTGFDPGDHFEVALGIEAQNSVDCSCAFEIRLRWKRLVCENGLWIQEDNRLRKIHNVDWMNRQDVVKFLQDRISGASNFKELMTRWLNTIITIEAIEAWADDILTNAWGVNNAARLCHIARSGFDGIVGRSGKKIPAHERVVSSDMEVPGACAPIKNLYHLSQALSWIAGQQEQIEDWVTKIETIPRLLKPFLGGKV